MTDRLTKEELAEIRRRRDEARAGEYHDSTVYGEEDRERLLDEVARLREENEYLKIHTENTLSAGLFVSSYERHIYDAASAFLRNSGDSLEATNE